MNELIVSLILSISQTQHVPFKVLRGIIQQESAGCNHQIVVRDGRTASFGCGQVKLKTAKWIMGKHGHAFSASDLFVPEKNITISAIYLRYLLKRYKGKVNCAVEAYNKGSARQCNGKYVNLVLR
jgi:soluble lytic murein transglycosylase-like protein